MTISPLNCPFCIRVRRGQYENRSAGVVWFEPLNPVTPGHMLFVPAVHTEWKDYAGTVRLELKWAVGEAVRYGHGGDFNIITSCGEDQTIPHIHVHLVPRFKGDGLALPWTGQQPQEGVNVAAALESLDTLDSWLIAHNMDLRPNWVGFLMRHITAAQMALTPKP